jgi:predicted methyltransferase
MLHPIITYREAEKILKAKEKEVEISLDLGLTLSKVQIEGNSVVIAGNRIQIDALKKVKDNVCHFIEENELKKTALYSDETQLYYALVPTKDWPTIKLSSTPMHRHISVSPKEDTISKIHEIEPVKGNVLDTCCGLGYTAIVAAKKADEVYTFERDKNILLVASYNPHSQQLFSNKKIRIFEQDVFEGIEQFNDDFFDRIIHDPPTVTISPDLYSDEFYVQLFRVMKQPGILYHYSPNPGKLKGREFYRTIIKKLSAAGFRKIEYSDKSSGVRAVK